MANSTHSQKPTQPKIQQNPNRKQQQQQPRPKQIQTPSPIIITAQNNKSKTPAAGATSSDTKPQSWSVIRSILSCKHVQTDDHRSPQPQPKTPPQHEKLKHKQKLQHHTEPGESSNSCGETKRFKKMKCSGSISICSNTKVMHRPELVSSLGSSFHTTSSIISDTATSNNNNVGSSSSSRSLKAPLPEFYVATKQQSSNSSSFSIIPFSSSSHNNSNANANHSSSATSSSAFKVTPFRRFSGCYECRMVVDPVVQGFGRDLSLRTSICTCPVCGDVFMKSESLEIHQAVRHAVSELGPEDTSKNIVEIIFQSSWLKKQTPVCKIDRILKVQNTPKTISLFESYRESIKFKANKTLKKHPRCIADGNELLRFHCTTLLCSLGLNGSTNLCNSIPTCSVCSVIKNGFRLTGKGILTTATSGKADDKLETEKSSTRAGEKRAMLVCRVIAGRVKKGNLEEFDSVSDGTETTYSSLDELYVFNPKAILPCFVVIYGES